MTFLICGVDEVGRGALAGPLIAVAALFRSQPCNTEPGTRLEQWERLHSPIPGVDDSKELSAKKRRTLFHQILRSPYFVDFGLGQVEAHEINEVGIDWANTWAFQRAMFDLSSKPNFTLVDGDSKIMGWDHQSQRNEPRGDGKWWPVGAASILAKVIRDSYMEELHKDWPGYGWHSNAGYGAEEHRRGLLQWGKTPEHRTKFIQRILESKGADNGS